MLDTLEKLLSHEEADKIRACIRSIPDRNTFLHGDFNSRNIMLRNDEFLLIDIGDAAVGHHVFDILGLMLAYIILPQTSGGNYSPERKRELLGFDFSLAPKVWNSLCGTYFALTNNNDIEALTARLLSWRLCVNSHSVLYFSHIIGSPCPALMLAGY